MQRTTGARSWKIQNPSNHDGHQIGEILSLSHALPPPIPSSSTPFSTLLVSHREHRQVVTTQRNTKMAPPKRGPTAYFLFADSARAEVRAELVAAASSTAAASSAAADPAAAAPSEAPKISVAAVAKGVGERWKALTDAEREAWKEKAAAKAAEAAAAREAAGAGGEEMDQGDEEAAAAAPSAASLSFPLSIVRKLIMLDPEVARVSADAAKAISAAAAAFAASTLAGSAAAVAAQNKRRTLRASDVTRAASRDTRCLDMGLLPVLNAVSGGGGGGGGAAGAAAGAPAAKENAKPSSAGSKRGPVAVGGGGSGNSAAEEEDANKKRKGKGIASAQKPVRPAAAFFAPYKGKAAAT